MKKNEFIDLVIAYGANGCTETENLTEKQKGVVAQAWAAFSHADENFGDKDADDYCSEAYEAAESYFFDFIVRITIKADKNHINAKSKVQSALYVPHHHSHEDGVFYYSSIDDAKAAIKVAYEILKQTDDETLDVGEEYVEYDCVTASID